LYELENMTVYKIDYSDVATEFASQVGNRSENAAGDDLAFDLGEPYLDLVEPRGIRR
jgi:hypothetical protein